MGARFVSLDLLQAFLARATLSSGMDSNRVVIAQPEELTALGTL